jgi:pimeloyl-ACP methyl ester carboxylesterase
MGADQRLLEPQRALPFPLIIPRWIEPEPGESLPDYARRMASPIDWPDRLVIGGVSFGGMVAAEIATQLRPAGLVLIATCLSARSIPTAYWFANALSNAIPTPLMGAAAQLPERFLDLFGGFDAPERRLIADMLADVSVRSLRRMADMVRQWRGVPVPTCPRLWIHGADDPVIPAKKVKPDVVIPAAGHLVNWTHAEEVNEQITRFVERLS